MQEMSVVSFFCKLKRFTILFANTTQWSFPYAPAMELANYTSSTFVTSTVTPKTLLHLLQIWNIHNIAIWRFVRAQWLLSRVFLIKRDKSCHYHQFLDIFESVLKFSVEHNISCLLFRHDVVNWQMSPGA